MSQSSDDTISQISPQPTPRTLHTAVTSPTSPTLIPTPTLTLNSETHHSKKRKMDYPKASAIVAVRMENNKREAKMRRLMTQEKEIKKTKQLQLFRNLLAIANARVAYLEDLELDHATLIPEAVWMEFQARLAMRQFFKKQVQKGLLDSSTFNFYFEEWLDQRILLITQMLNKLSNN